MEVEWVEGETATRYFILKEDGVPFDLTGLTVALSLWDRGGLVVDTTGDVAAVLPQTGSDKGKVGYTPDAADLTVAKEPLRARFKITDQAGGVGYFPRDEAQIWRVYKP